MTTNTGPCARDTRGALRVLLLALSLSLAACSTATPPVAAARAELAPAGKLRVAINFGNPVLAQKDPATGEPRGVSVDLARELARRLDVPIELVTYAAAGRVFEALKSNAWDVAFLAIDPARAAEIAFTAPYVVIEGAYMVRADSPLKANDDVDREGVKVVVGKGSAYDLYLSRTLKRAQIVRAPTSPEALEWFVRDRSYDVAANIRQPLVAHAKDNPGMRVMDGRFMAIEQAMGTPRGRDHGARYLRQFVEDMKASGFVARGLERSGQKDAAVAPPAR
jgi:polar amino acid transport system substrate-binding protein